MIALIIMVRVIVVDFGTTYARRITVWLNHVLKSEEGSPCVSLKKERI